MMRKVLAVAVAATAALLPATATPGSAAIAAGQPNVMASVTESPRPPVLVVNNHTATVEVFAVDEDGVRHRLGRVMSAAAKTFEVPEDALQADGNALIKIYPESAVPGLGTPMAPAPGIKTVLPLAQGGDGIVFWLEPGLTDSFTQRLAG